MDKTFQKWCNEFQEGRHDVHAEIMAGNPSVVTNEIIQKTEE